MGRTLLIVFLAALTASGARADVFDDMRGHWADHLTGGALDLTQPDLRQRVEAMAEAACAN